MKRILLEPRRLRYKIYLTSFVLLLPLLGFAQTFDSISQVTVTNTTFFDFSRSNRADGMGPPPLTDIVYALPADNRDSFWVFKNVYIGDHYVNMCECTYGYENTEAMIDTIFIHGKDSYSTRSVSLTIVLNSPRCFRASGEEGFYERFDETCQSWCLGNLRRFLTAKTSEEIRNVYLGNPSEGWQYIDSNSSLFWKIVSYYNTYYEEGSKYGRPLDPDEMYLRFIFARY